MNKRNFAVAVSAAFFCLLPLNEALVAQSAPRQIGLFEGSSDVGTVLHAGKTVFDPRQGTYTVTGSGENMWKSEDAFQFVWKKASGDMVLTADVRFPAEGGNPHRKAVLMVRQNLENDAVYADVALHGSGLTALQYRLAKSAPTRDIELNIDAPARLRLEKRGDLFTLYLGNAGEPLRPAGAAAKVHLEGSFYVGLGVCSHDKDRSETAVFSNVSLESPAPTTSAKPILWSTLQSMALEPIFRRGVVAYTTEGYLEAPNWSRDGKELIFDQGGKMYRVAVDGGKPQLIETGAVDHCNGSHGLSPDGSSLAITCSPAGGPGAQIFRVPLGGGEPKLVTQNPQSYWHSWSPDGKTILFTRPANGSLNIFAIPAEGGKEVALTTGTGVSDDPDYSPDGKYIYFNSDRAGGSMQIWRMHPDGSSPEQITSDERNNWTPHPSPDGKWIVYLSYDKDVKGHPANKEIEVRLMSLSDRKIETLVNILGGSGTMNVPSWAPDSQHVAFVSYELLPAAN